MDKISKALKKLSLKECKQIQELLVKIESENIAGLDLKKLKEQENIFRVRKGNLRIIFQRKNEVVALLAIERRSDNTYRKF